MAPGNLHKFYASSPPSVTHELLLLDIAASYVLAICYILLPTGKNSKACLGFSYPGHNQVESRSDLDCNPGQQVIWVSSCDPISALSPGYISSFELTCD